MQQSNFTLGNHENDRGQKNLGESRVNPKDQHILSEEEDDFDLGGAYEEDDNGLSSRNQ